MSDAASTVTACSVREMRSYIKQNFYTTVSELSLRLVKSARGSRSKHLFRFLHSRVGSWEPFIRSHFTKTGWSSVFIWLEMFVRAAPSLLRMRTPLSLSNGAERRLEGAKAIMSHQHLHLVSRFHLYINR